jgi:hypothetical protein
MIQTKTIAVVLIAIGTRGTIGIAIGTGIQSVHAFIGGFGPTQNDNSQGNNNIQGATSCFSFRLPPACGEPTGKSAVETLLFFSNNRTQTTN